LSASVEQTPAAAAACPHRQPEGEDLGAHGLVDHDRFAETGAAVDEAMGDRVEPVRRDLAEPADDTPRLVLRHEVEPQARRARVDYEDVAHRRVRRARSSSDPSSTSSTGSRASARTAAPAPAVEVVEHCHAERRRAFPADAISKQSAASGRAGRT
jgi:hypothetical protein